MPDEMDATTRKRSLERNERILFLCNLIFKDLREAISSNSLCSLHEEWPELEKFRFWEDRLLLPFAALTESVTKALNILSSQQTQLESVGLDEDGSVAMCTELQPGLDSSYRN